MQRVPAEDVQECLRQAFSRWGRPEALRLDNGSPWGSRSDLPSGLTLWLTGLDIQASFNPPRQPQKNGVVERFQGVGKQWSEPHTCHTPAELEARFVHLDRLQRERYPVQAEQSRRELFPELKHSGRPYSRRWERRHWDAKRMRYFLAEHVVPRTVDESGTVSVYYRTLYVGKKHRRQTVYITFDPEDGQWVILDQHERFLRTCEAPEVNPADLLNIHGQRRRARRHGPTSRRN